MDEQIIEHEIAGDGLRGFDDGIEIKVLKAVDPGSGGAGGFEMTLVFGGRVAGVHAHVAACQQFGFGVCAPELVIVVGFDEMEMGEILFPFRNPEFCGEFVA